MKIVSVLALALFLCGCDYSTENRAAVVSAIGSSEVYLAGFEYIGRDTNGAVWTFDVRKGSITAKAKIFEAPK